MKPLLLPHMLVLNDDEGTRRSSAFELVCMLLSSATPEVDKPVTVPEDEKETDVSPVPASKVENTVLPVVAVVGGGGG